SFSRSFHLRNQVRIRLGTRKLLEENLDGVDWGEGVEGVAKLVYVLQRFRRQEELVAQRDDAFDVDGGEDATLRDLAVQHDLRVPGPLELLEDHLVAAAPRLGQHDSDDGEAPSPGLLRDVARRAEEALRLLQRSAVDPARQRTTRPSLRRIVGARQAS